VLVLPFFLGNNVAPKVINRAILMFGIIEYVILKISNIESFHVEGSAIPKHGFRDYDNL
jgi:hypothetical protein